MPDPILDTFSREGNAFIQRHPDLPDTAKSLGGLTWGILRAVLECPNCPGNFRVPQDQEGRVLYSPCCGTWWELPPEKT